MSNSDYDNEQTYCDSCYKECSKDELVEFDGDILCIRCLNQITNIDMENNND